MSFCNAKLPHVSINSTEKNTREFIFIIPSGSNPVIRFVLRFFLRTPTTFSALILCALTPARYCARVISQKLFWSNKDFVKNALVGISCSTSNAAEAYWLGDRFRRAGSTVIMGGTHASYFPEEALKHCDSVVIGEAESVWAQVLSDYENKTLQQIYRGQALDDYFSPVYDYFMQVDPKLLYRSGIMLSRGCKYSCDFCARPFGKLRFVKLSQAIGLLQHTLKAAKPLLWLKPTLIFRDDNIFSDPEYAKKLFKEMMRFKINWVANSSVDIAFDDEALRLAKESGCVALFVGFETIYPQKQQKTSVGNMRSSDDYLRAIRNIRANHIRVTGAFILGFDYYTRADYIKLIFFLLRSRLYMIALTILTPFPGSFLFDKLQRENRITSYNWGDYDSLIHVVFKPSNMSAAELRAWFAVTRLLSVLASPMYWETLLRIILVSLLSYFSTLYFAKWLLHR